MRTVLWCVALVGCGVEMSPEERDAAAQMRAGPFVDEVIRELGTNGEACETDRATGVVSCVSNSKLRPVPLVPGDDPADSLYLCTETSGTLGSCTSIGEAYHCAEAVGCWCSGIDDCIKLADSGKCDEYGNGHCGPDCGGDDSCCCTW
jgi:hypothetical protein